MLNTSPGPHAGARAALPPESHVAESKDVEGGVVAPVQDGAAGAPDREALAASAARHDQFPERRG